MRSPNFGERRDGAKPHIIVIHYTAMELEPSLERLCDPSAEVSAHYVIARDGELVQLVDEDKRAWHAGHGTWRDVDDVNSHSIGIELVNLGDEPFPAAQMRVLRDLLSDLMKRHSVDRQNVIGHSDMAPGRKSDPGRRFDWAALAREGLAVAVPPIVTERMIAVNSAAFQRALRAIGYPESELETGLAAFRARFHPTGQGELNAYDCVIAELLTSKR